MSPDDLYRFGAAMGIGALVGLERQVSGSDPQAGAPEPGSPPAPSEEDLRLALARGEASGQGAELSGGARAPEPRERVGGVVETVRPAGLRTHILVALGGALAAHLAGGGQPGAFPLAFLAVAALVVASYVDQTRRGGDPGLTSEVSLLLVFLLGGLCGSGEASLAAAAAVAVTATLSLKQMLHAVARGLHQTDIHAALKFAAVTVVVLPLLPAEPLVVADYLPAAWQGEPGAWWQAVELSPRKVWLMVILISGVSFTGYVLGKTMGERGLWMTGAVGGLVSSTAVSISFAQRSREAPALSAEFGVGILLANAIMPARLLLVVGVAAPALLRFLMPSLLGMTAVAGVAALVLLLRRPERGGQAEVDLRNPFEIGPALKFGGMFALVLLLAQLLEHWFGTAGLYVLAFVTGLTDVDAMGLAAGHMVVTGQQPAATGAVVVILAALSNTLVKGGFAATAGARQLRRIILVSFGLMALAAVLGVVWITVGA